MHQYPCYIHTGIETRRRRGGRAEAVDPIFLPIPSPPHLQFPKSPPVP